MIQKFHNNSQELYVILSNGIDYVHFLLGELNLLSHLENVPKNVWTIMGYISSTIIKAINVIFLIFEPFTSDVKGMLEYLSVEISKAYNFLQAYLIIFFDTQAKIKEPLKETIIKTRLFSEMIKNLLK